MTLTMPDTDEAQRIIEALDLDDSIPCEGMDDGECDRKAVWCGRLRVPCGHNDTWLCCDEHKNQWITHTNDLEKRSRGHHTHCPCCNACCPSPLTEKCVFWTPIEGKS